MAGPFVFPAVSVVSFHFDHTGKTCTDAAAHQMVDGELSIQFFLIQQFCQSHQHRMRSAAIEEKLFIGIVFQHAVDQFRNETLVTDRTVIGRQTDIVTGLFIGIHQQNIRFGTGSEQEAAP